jgi:SAM-dependent methyltransferase
MYRLLKRLLDQGVIARTDSFLVVGSGAFDEAVMAALGLNATATNINAAPEEAATDAGRLLQDARHLLYPDNAFDCVITHATLHHVDRPHQAVCEMYRVARKTAIFCEAQDSLLMRLAVRLGLVVDYEMNAIRDTSGQGGGVNYTPVPNYVYRWTRREIEKLVRSLDPAREPQLLIVTEWDFSWKRVARRLLSSPLRVLGTPVLSLAARAGVGAANLLLSRQGNMFAVCIRKDRARLQPWMEEVDGTLRFRDPAPHLARPKKEAA